MSRDDPPATTLSEAISAGRRAAALGFDWEHAVDALDKVAEELAELRHAIEQADDDATTEELGDLYFAVSNVARKLAIDPDACLTAATRKFEYRFKLMVDAIRDQGQRPQDLTIDELERFWVSAKGRE